MARHPGVGSRVNAKTPDMFEGVVSIEWINGASPGVLPGWSFTLCLEDGTPIRTVTDLTLHASAEGVAWVELTMFADEDYKPVLTGPPHFVPGTQDGTYYSGTFPFLVSRMSAVRGGDRQCPVKP